MIGLDPEDRERSPYDTERGRTPRSPVGLDDEDWEEDWLFL